MENNIKPYENRRLKLLVSDGCRFFKYSVKEIIKKSDGDIDKIYSELKEKFGKDNISAIDFDVIKFYNIEYKSSIDTKIKVSGIITSYGILINPKVTLIWISKNKTYEIDVSEENIIQ